MVMSIKRYYFIHIYRLCYDKGYNRKHTFMYLFFYCRLLEYESCDKLQSDIMEQLALRQRELKNSDNFTRLSATIRIRLKQFTNELSQLKKKLKDSASNLYPYLNDEIHTQL